MRRPFLILGILILSICGAGCARSDSGDVGVNESRSALQLAEYTDANVALADGTKFLDEGETENAINALNQAVKLNPDLAEGWFKLGIAYALAEKRDETLVIANESETPSSKSPTAKPNSVKAFEKAVAAYKKQVDANDEDDAAYFNLGRAYNKLNEDQDAAKALKQAVKLKPDDTEYQTELGSILIKLAQYHEAVAALKKALELDPENIRALELLEDAEAGRKRVSYSSTPKEDKKGSNSNTNTNTAATPPVDVKPPPSPDVAPPKIRPTPSRPGL
ncbi:MAG TPA: tetratricopeptide repeat protein [Pyrinomonadaceae bacterium]|nr:tetratricopeptide repeat protein [Pyrinomonadaceae bacterium]